MKKKSIVPLLVVVPSLVLSISTGHAGTGTFNGGKHNFCASVRFNATADQLAKIRAAFSSGSQVLADATDGQHQFSKIKIVNNSGATQSAEYWINPGAGRAYATYGEYGVRGQHVNLYYDSNFTLQNGADGDAYTIAHEHAHHSYGVADEYSGPAGNAEDAPTPDTAALDFSLMDNYFTRGGRAFGAGYTLNEFCTNPNHDPDGDTWQHKMRGKSVWETIATHPKRPAILPVGLPVSAPAPPHVVSFEEGFGGLRAMLLLDRSGSMSIDQRLEFGKQGASQFVNVFASGDSLGLASFSDGASIGAPLGNITDAASRGPVQGAINALVAGGSTNIGGGLLAALGQITAQSTRSCDELIILLSDGDHNTGTSPAAALPALQAEGVTVLSVGVGSGISTAGEATLQNISSQTGGKFYRIASAAGLVGVFMQLSAESSGQGLLARAPEAISAGLTRQIPVLVETGVEKATFAITFANAQDALQMSLISPSGQVFTAADTASNPALTFNGSANSRVFQVNAPQSGNWQMVVSAGAVTTGKFETLAFATNNGVQLNVSIEKNTLVFPESAEIHATPTFKGENVVGAAITGSVQRPDGTSVEVQLFDDGLTEHGDGLPADGIYSARFGQYQGDGTYTFQMKVVNATGTTYAGEPLHQSQPSNQKAVPAFSRVASTTAVVTGVPQYLVATVEYGPETINLKSQGQFVTAYIELPDRLDPRSIDVRGVKLTAVDGASVSAIPVVGSSSIGDFDNDGIADLMVKFSRQSIQNVVTPGMRKLRLEGTAGGRLFIGERSVGVINPGNTQ